MAEMDGFEYDPIDLERPAFRLLQLLQGDGPAIECMLYQAFLDGTDTVPYEALSYTWGSIEKSAIVIVNGKALKITTNLYTALQHLRSKHVDKILWVDAICINQENERERGHQVQQMCKIYSQAEAVTVWLGESTDETDLLMESLQRLDEYSSTERHKNWDFQRWKSFWKLIPRGPASQLLKGLSLLLQRPWFRRVWVLQEISNSRRASICCGKQFVKARTFAIAPLLLGMKPERHCQAVLDIMPGRLREESWWSESRDLYNLLSKFRESEASDPRDKVYALLGISSDAYDHDNLRPDYTKSLQEVIQNTSTFLFRRSNVVYETMSTFLADLSARNSESFLNIVRTSGVSEVDYFLTRRGLEVPLPHDTIKAITDNVENGSEIMRLLVRKRINEVKVAKDWIIAAVGDLGYREDFMVPLLQRCKTWTDHEEIMSAFHTASAEGKEAVVEVLLNSRSDMHSLFIRRAQGRSIGHATNEFYGNALYQASANGHDRVVKLLLDSHAEVEERPEHQSTGTQAVPAHANGHEQVVRQLLEYGARVNSVSRLSGFHGNALMAASESGHEQVVKLLLDKGAEPLYNDVRHPPRNALLAASRGGHALIVKMLLDKITWGHTHRNLQSQWNHALNVASARGHDQIVKLLLDKSVDLNVDMEPSRDLALQAASANGHEKVVEPL
ncbi:ankyrin, partial [Phaeosphaeriaceae sp. SRC1lsM3a]